MSSLYTQAMDDLVFFGETAMCRPQELIPVTDAATGAAYQRLEVAAPLPVASKYPSNYQHSP